MDGNNIFDDLFIFDTANNHQGSLKHGKKIISSVSEICKKKGCRGAIKFQYRQLDTYIHPDFKEAQEPKHIRRFLSTRLANDDYRILVDEVKRSDLLTMCTPFDEESVDIIEDHKIDIIKIASCSSQDWPLIERIAESRKPVVCSTAGCTVSDIDKIVSFFTHRKIPLAIMHCVALYPTDVEDLQLSQIDVLKNRYPFLPVGFSTHENPNNFLAVQIAIAKGVRLLERHVGLETDAIKLNAYSSTPDQIGEWLDTANKAKRACGAKVRLISTQAEIDSLNSLKRGVYAKKRIIKGAIVTRKDVFFAMPLQSNQLVSGEFAEKFEAKRNYEINQPIQFDEVEGVDLKKIIYSVIHEAKGMLYQARISIGKEFRVELSHHYGIEKFNKVGAIIIDCVNREYCKKIIIQIYGQYHPEHYHKLKEETFHVLWGEMLLKLDGKDMILRPGDQVIIKQGQKHSFTTKTGVIVEELSTTHYKDDSYYEDSTIYTEPAFRKTQLENAQHTFEQYSFL